MRGFTLIELILYIAIITIVMSALIPFAWNIIGGSVKSSALQEVSSQARFVSERIKYEIRNANDINNISAFSIDLKTDTNPTTVIELADGKITIKYGISGTPVNLNSDDTVIAPVGDAIFTDYGSVDAKTKHIQFSFTIDDKYTGSRQEYQVPAITIESSAELRNN
ncbi:type II secretion system protein [Candidatus Daviesbacteria bacterium]|nr:type II secretion system protein [Candidatus Daviesbacteria bacterium]